MHQSFIIWAVYSLHNIHLGLLFGAIILKVINGTTIIHNGRSHHPIVFQVIVFLLNGIARLVLSTLISKIISFYIYTRFPCVVGPCHHGMARPQVADRGTASNMEGSCE